MSAVKRVKPDEKVQEGYLNHFVMQVESLILIVFLLNPKSTKLKTEKVQQEILGHDPFFKQMKSLILIVFVLSPLNMKLKKYSRDYWGMIPKLLNK